jgi:uncharacterized membrane protein YphA (DoxX/SURF4 family)
LGHPVLVATALSIGLGVIRFSPRPEFLDVQFSLPPRFICATALSSLSLCGCFVLGYFSIFPAAVSAFTLLVYWVFFVVSRAPSIAIFGHARGLAGLYGLARVPACQSAVLTAAQATVQVGAPEGRAVCGGNRWV